MFKMGADGYVVVYNYGFLLYFHNNQWCWTPFYEFSRNWSLLKCLFRFTNFVIGLSYWLTSMCVSIIAWESPWTEEPGGSMGSQKTQTWLSNQTTATIYKTLCVIYVYVCVYTYMHTLCTSLYQILCMCLLCVLAFLSFKRYFLNIKILVKSIYQLCLSWFVLLALYIRKVLPYPGSQWCSPYSFHFCI